MNEEHPVNALPKKYRLQEYELVRVLGFGGFGMTYLGYDHNLDRPVAIKEYLPLDIATRTSDHSVVPQASEFRGTFEWGLNSFLDEARTLARFDHRHIIKVLRFFEAHGTGYIVMEYAEGETLSDYLNRKGTLTESELKEILFPLLAGLEEVHGADFLHRDIKPGNIIIRAEDGSPVLLDFGAARQAIGAKSRSLSAILTPGYAPFEQYSTRGAQGPWTDLYALGAVCYRALTGEVPDDAIDRTHDDPLVPLAERCDEDQASPGFLSAIDRALQVNKEYRPQTIGAWRAELGDAPDISDPDPQKPLPPDKSGTAPGISVLDPDPLGGRISPPSNKRKPPPDDPEPLPPGVRSGGGKGVWVALGACVVLAVVGLGGYWVVGEIDRRAEAKHQAAMDLQAAKARQDAEVARQVSALLSGATADLSSNRLTSPDGANAWEKYQEVLQLESGHKDALSGLASIISRYAGMFEDALSRGDLGLASDYVSRIRQVDSDASVLGELERRLGQAQEAARQAKIKRQAEIKRQVNEHVSQFEAALSGGDLVSASGYVSRIRALDEDASVLGELERRLGQAQEAARQANIKRQAAEAARQAEIKRQAAEAARQAEIKRQVNEHVSQFEVALSGGDLVSASGYVSRIRALDEDASVLGELERRLADAKALLAELARQRSLAPGRTFKDCGECPQMVVVPSGWFMMGSPSNEKDRSNDEGPQHRVEIEYRLAVGVYEVTFAEWDACVASGGCNGYRPDDAGWGRGARPVIKVSWKDARSYVSWLSSKTGHSYRLLSESEWEYVARAGTVTPFHFGETISTSQANYDGDYTYGSGRQGVDREKTVSVGSFSPNAFGLYDVHGNVQEWTQDCWNGSYSGAPGDGSSWERGDCSKRVLRGGSWDNYPWLLRSAIRYGNSTAGYRYNFYGFRVARRF